MDLFGTGDFPLLTVNISVVNSLNWFTFSSRLCELQSCRRCTTRTPNRARAPELQTKPLPESRDSSGRPICTVLHVDYHCLYSSLFGFFCFQLGWGRPLCVYWGEGLKIIIPNFLMYCLFFFFFGFSYTILSSDLRPPFGPAASWRLQVFCTLWWMLIGVFIIQSWMSFLVRSFLSLIPFPFRHHHCFLKSQKTFRFGLLQKGPKCCTLHVKVLSPRCEVPARKRMNDRKKKKN